MIEQVESDTIIRIGNIFKFPLYVNNHINVPLHALCEHTVSIKDQDGKTVCKVSVETLYKGDQKFIDEDATFEKAQMVADTLNNGYNNS